MAHRRRARSARRRGRARAARARRRDRVGRRLGAEHGRLRTLVNAGVLGAGEAARPSGELYPVDSFPALVSLLERRRPYCFGRGDAIDVSSASLAASLGKETQAAAPIT